LIDRILRATRPSELSVETPTKFELVVNLKAATALGLMIPESFLLCGHDRSIGEGLLLRVMRALCQEETT